MQLLFLPKVVLLSSSYYVKQLILELKWKVRKAHQRSSCVLIIILLLHLANVLATTKDVLCVRKIVCQRQLTNPIVL